MYISTLERKILNCIQEDIPLEPRPFMVIAKRLGIGEDRLIKQIKKLKDKRVIYKLSASISHKKLGFKSSLVALKVSLDDAERIAKKIITYPQVTHCFLREGEYNLWIVFIYKNNALKIFLDKLAKQVGRENILNLPTLRKFKLKTVLHLGL